MGIETSRYRNLKDCIDCSLYEVGAIKWCAIDYFSSSFCIFFTQKSHPIRNLIEKLLRQILHQIAIQNLTKDNPWLRSIALSLHWNLLCRQRVLFDSRMLKLIYNWPKERLYILRDRISTFHANLEPNRGAGGYTGKFASRDEIFRSDIPFPQVHGNLFSIWRAQKTLPSR